MAIEAYRRRRGWLAWNTAGLQRFEFKDEYPSLQQMMGLPEPRENEEQRQVMLSHNLRLWRSVLDRKEAAGAA